MKLKLPEDIKSISAEDLAALLDAAIEEYAGVADIDDADLTDEQLADLVSLSEAVELIQAETTVRDTAASERAEKAAAARGKIDAVKSATAATEQEPGETDEDDEDEETEDENAEDENVEASEKEKEPVAASAARKSAVVRAARKTDIKPPVAAAKPSFSLIASADVPEYQAGVELDSFTDVAKAFMNRSRSFRSMGGNSRAQEGLRRFGVAKMNLPENELTLGMNMSVEDQLAVIDRAAKQDRLPQGSLIAAGGWCAPSETLYDFVSVETIDGILSIPEVTINRGGINFTKGPDYGTLAADWGFLQTETQAEAGTAKVCYEVECPDFSEVRLDAIGFCIKAGILTNAAYPELVRRVLEIGAVAHAHKVNAQVISRIATALGTAIDYTEQGSGTVDLLNALELNAEVLRYRYSLAIGATIEVVLPAWARLIARQDLANRNGVDFMAITEAQLNSFFSVRGLAVQFVYDYQPITTTGATVGQAMETSVTALMYPAGAFIKGTAPVIDLDTVYDSTGLSTNTYTAAFFEQGLLVANRGVGGARVTIALNYQGASGFPSIGAGEGVTIPVVTP